MAIMVGAMTIHGIVPGPQIMTKQPDLFWGMIASMWVGNLMLVIINLPLIGLWVKLLKVPYGCSSRRSAVLLHRRLFDQQPAVRRADDGRLRLLGYFLLKVGFEPAPMLIAFVLGKLMEEKAPAGDADLARLGAGLHRAPALRRLPDRRALLLIFALLPAMRKKRDEVFVEA